MANFNPADYELVEQRIARFYKDHIDGRIITKNLTTLQDRQVSTWVVRAEIWLPFPGDVDEKFGWSKQPGAYLKSSGLAFEVDGSGMANKTSALENAETSAIGRALANAGYSGNKRTTREEMAKVERGVTPARPARDWLTELDVHKTEKNVAALRLLYADAVAAKVNKDILAKIKTAGEALK